MKIISGGQTGADMAGLMVGKELGYKTGGWAPKNWKTSEGSKKILLKSYNLIESIYGYKGRTQENVRDSDITIRLAINFNSLGEKCTMEAIIKYKKMWLDINLLNPIPVQEALVFLLDNQPQTINIAGNTQYTNGHDIEGMVYNYLKLLLEKYKILMKKFNGLERKNENLYSRSNFRTEF